MLLAMENQQIITSEILAMLIIDLWSRSLITDYVMRNSFIDIFFRGSLLPIAIVFHSQAMQLNKTYSI